MNLQTTEPKEKTIMDSRVMVIGNNRTAINNLASLLKRSGIEPTTVHNESWRIERLSEILPSAVIVEDEAESRGWEISSQIRHESDVPIILLGTADSEIAWVKAAAHGIDCYLTRPFNPLELVSRIRALIRRHENNQRRFTRNVAPLI